MFRDAWTKIQKTNSGGTTWAMDVAGGAIIRFTDWSGDDQGICSMVFVPGESVKNLLERLREKEC